MQLMHDKQSNNSVIRFRINKPSHKHSCCHRHQVHVHVLLVLAIIAELWQIRLAQALSMGGQTKRVKQTLLFSIR